MRKLIIALLFIILVYTRFVNIGWGLPYTMHPDERNMAVAIQQLNCEFSMINDQFSKEGCMNPHFFAYGQLPLYIGFFLVQIYHFFSGKFGQLMNIEEAIMALRFISAIASIISVFVGLKIVQLIIFSFQFSIFNKYSISKFSKLLTTNYLLLTLILFTFSPGLIQFAHFGTTESLLMLFYLLIVYEPLRSWYDRSEIVNVFFLAVFSGLAIATKVSAGVFLIIPLIALFFSQNGYSLIEKFYQALKFVILSLIVGILLSPYNIISLRNFLGSMNYESSIATGRYVAFYTRQFLDSIPVIFHISKIFPYVLGWPVFMSFILGFVFLPRSKEINILRLAILIYFIPNAFFYAKWTRFMAPVFPLMIIFAVLFLISVCHSRVGGLLSCKGNLINKLQTKLFFIIIFIIVFLLPGIAYLSIYQNPDVRFQASSWIYKNIPDGSKILSETANVVDLPVINGQDNVLSLPKYKYVSFNFYDLDENPILQKDLKNYLIDADYIFIPSRRIFMNLYQNTYPILTKYYQQLFSGKLGFEKVAEFTSYPKISFLGKTLIEFPDEQAEETWTVFDHPVIRIYKRIPQ